MQRLAAKQTANIPKVWSDWTEALAAYLIPANDEIEWADIPSHLGRTLPRMGIGGMMPPREQLGVTVARMRARQCQDGGRACGTTSETARLIEGCKRVAELAGTLPPAHAYLTIREADLIDLVRRAQTPSTLPDWLDCAKHNRCFSQGEKLWSHTFAGEPLGVIMRALRSRQGEIVREGHRELGARRVEIPGGRFGPVAVTRLVAREVGAPADTLERALALLMAGAWRIPQFKRTARSCREQDVTLFCDPDEIQGAYLLMKIKPNRVPRLNAVLSLIATSRAFLAGKGDGEPGVKTVWLVLQRVMDAATTILVLRNSEAMVYV